MRTTSSSASIGHTPTVLTLRGVDPALRSALETEAVRLGLSLNALILHTLRGVYQSGHDSPLHHDLDALAGSWSREEADEFRAAVEAFEEIDPMLWMERPDGS
jgi:hypothetical protein